MIYVLALLIPPLALLIEGHILHAILNVIVSVIVLVLSLLTLFTFLFLLLVPAAHAIIVIAQSRRQREHREIVDALKSGNARPEDVLPR